MPSVSAFKGGVAVLDCQQNSRGLTLSGRCADINAGGLDCGMIRPDYLFASILGAVVFGCAGFLAGSAYCHLLCSASTSSHIFHSAGYAATLCGLLLGPSMVKKVRANELVSGFAVMFFAGIIYPLIMTLTNPALGFSFPNIGLHDFGKIMALPYFGLFVLLFTFPFGIGGGVIFSWIVRLVSPHRVVRRKS